jgi:hypothetical protein
MASAAQGRPQGATPQPEPSGEADSSASNQTGVVAGGGIFIDRALSKASNQTAAVAEGVTQDIFTSETAAPPRDALPQLFSQRSRRQQLPTLIAMLGALSVTVWTGGMLLRKAIWDADAAYKQRPRPSRAELESRLRSRTALSDEQREAILDQFCDKNVEESSVPRLGLAGFLLNAVQVAPLSASSGTQGTTVDNRLDSLGQSRACGRHKESLAANAFLNT